MLLASHMYIRQFLSCPNVLILVIDTTRAGHAQEIAKGLTLDFDAVITVSGDGLVHEVLNGFAQHAESTKAFAIPVAPIPAGSGNALSLNLLGIEVSIISIFGKIFLIAPLGRF